MTPEHSRGITKVREDEDRLWQARGKMTRAESRAHANCVVCGPTNPRGLGLDFDISTDGGVEAHFDCDRSFEGYDNVLHGGVVASLLDGAMTHCLFARGRPAMTAELTVRFRHPVAIGRSATVRAWITRDDPPLYVLKARVTQDGEVKATATGKFMDPPRPVERSSSREKVQP